MSFTVTDKSSKMSTTKLTDEQLKRMEENRLKALERIAQKRKENGMPVTTTTAPANTTNKVHTLSSIAPKSVQPLAPITKQVNSDPPGTLSGKCQLLAEDPENRFEIIIGYNKGLIDLFKSINSRKYDAETKRWNFSLKSYDEIVCRIKNEFNNTIKLEPLDRNNKKSLMLKFFLINNQTFEAQVDFSQDLNEIFKTMKTKRYDPNTKRWSFNLNEYEELIAGIRAKMGASVNIVQLPKMVKEIFKDKIMKTTEKQADIDLEHLRYF